MGVLSAVVVGTGCFGAVAQAAALPDHRAYELVSAPDKNGADALLATVRTRVAADGNAFGYAALAGFADAHAVEVASDYLAVRSSSPDPGSSGWTTHGITPVQRALSFFDVLTAQEPFYTGPYSPDLNAGVFFGVSPLTNDPMVSGVPNLYRRMDLLTPGAGTFQLVTACPLCDATNTPLPPLSGDQLSRPGQRPLLAGVSADLGHVVFESRFDLTSDAPPQQPLCDPAHFPFSFVCWMRLYDWDNGTVRLAGVLPDGSAADASFAGEGVYHNVLTPDVVSDGLDGHSRIFFTQPTDSSGNTLTNGDPFEVNFSLGGNLFMRVDHTVTVQLNVSERAAADTFAPATFLDASKDGTRAFFMTTQALTDDAPADGLRKIYMYDAAKPSSDPHKLTLVDPDAEPGDGTADAVGAVGVGGDGHYFYFIQNDELVSGGPLGGASIYLWHDGLVSRVGPAPPTDDAQEEDLATGVPWVLRERQSRVSADGRTLLFSTISGDGLTGYDHGSCSTGIGVGCRELYVYSADTGRVACASCNPSGAPAVGMATVFLGDNTIGGTRVDPPTSAPLTADGSKVFFSSPDALVPADTNGRYDAYEYDVGTGRVALLTSGRSTTDSYFVNASADGSDAFVITRERLVGWDRDDAYDIYDVRVGGGFPEPPPPPIPCQGDACQGLPAPSIGAYSAQGSAVFNGVGNAPGALRRHRSARRRGVCGRGRVRRRVKGRSRCVRVRARHRAARGRKARSASGGRA